INLAVMERDLTELENGLETMVGPKGVKLSGGQIQRTAAARMFVREPELLVFDDLSSALDVETEKTLWERVLDGRRTPDSGRTTDDGASAVGRPPSADGQGDGARGDGARGDGARGDGAHGARPGFTCLVVSHRKAALRRADHILVLQEGRGGAGGEPGHVSASRAETAG